MAGSETVIELQGLRRTYTMGEHEVHALRGVDLRIERGEFVAIIGPSGSGKSTLMYLLGCLDTPTAGSYRLAGREVAELSDRELSTFRNRHIGFVFQQYHLLAELTVVENVALGLTYGGVPQEVRQDVARQLAAAMGLGERFGHTAMELSGGQMQRVAISRALAVRPDLILADEPTGNLDSVAADRVMALLGRLHAQGGRSILLITHEARIATRAARVAVLADGRLCGAIDGDEVRDPTRLAQRYLALTQATAGSA